MNIIWAYMRKGWASCTKAQEVLESKKIRADETVNARNVKIDSDAAWQILKKRPTLIIGRGKKYAEFEPDEKNREAILKAALGRTGNLRAPALDMGDKLIIGFNQDMYAKFVQTPD